MHLCCQRVIPPFCRGLGPTFVSGISERWIAGMKPGRWQWHLDEVFVKVSGEQHYL